MKTLRFISILTLVVLVLSACDLVQEEPADQPLPSGPTLEQLPLEVATTAPASPGLLPSDTPSQPEPTLRPTQTTIPATATPTLFPEYVTHFVTDETGAITINVPTVWADQLTLPWLDEKGKQVGTIFIVATNVDKFLTLEAEGVAISVSKRLPIGYIELLDREVPNYLGICDDTYHTRWDVNTDTHRGQEAILNCHGSSYEWLAIMTLVNKSDPGAYIVRLVGFDMIPIFGDDFRDMLRKFEVEPQNLP